MLWDIDRIADRAYLQSISILGSYVGNRQDAREAIDIAARGEVKVHFVCKDLKELSKYVTVLFNNIGF